MDIRAVKRFTGISVPKCPHIKCAKNNAAPPVIILIAAVFTGLPLFLQNTAKVSIVIKTMYGIIKTLSEARGKNCWSYHFA